MRRTETRIQTPVAYVVPLLLARWTNLYFAFLLFYLFTYLFFVLGGREGFFSFFFFFFFLFFFFLRLVKISSKVPSIHKFGILDMMPASVSK